MAVNKYQNRRIWMNTGAAIKRKNIALEDATVRRTREIYRKAEKDIQNEVTQIYKQFGVIAESNRWSFKGLNTPATRKDVSALIKAIEKAGLTDYVPEPIRNRMSVLQVKQMNAWLRLHQAGKESHTLTKDAILKSMQTSGKAWADALKAGADGFVGFDRNICGYMMGMNWEDGNFSSRLWNTTNETWEKVREELTRALANGQQPQTTRKRIEALLTQGHNPNTRGSGGLSYDVERIIRTETAKASTQADLARWREAGVTKVQWHAAFEKNTCAHCADRDGRVYELKETMLDEPPLHPNCRCYFAAYDEVAAQFPDTTYYKDDEGEYQEIQWAPYRSVIDEQGNLRNSAIKVADYFWKASPWTQYPPAKSGITYKGEIDDQVLDIAERTIKDLENKYPEIADRLRTDFNNEITMHRGNSIIDGSNLTSVGGLTDFSNKQLTISYIDRAGGKNPLSQMADQALDQFKRGKWSTPKDNHTIIHELAHVFSRDLQKARGINIEDFMSRVVGTRSWKKAKKIIAENISEYASKNAEEAFAETFTRVVTQDQTLQNEITTRFVETLAEARKIPRTKPTTKKLRID